MGEVEVRIGAGVMAGYSFVFEQIYVCHIS